MGLEVQGNNIKTYDVEINIVNEKDETISNKLVMLEGISKVDVANYVLTKYLEQYHNGDFSNYKSTYITNKLKKHYFEIVAIEEKQGDNNID